jgi:hypothetical protein
MYIAPFYHSLNVNDETAFMSSHNLYKREIFYIVELFTSEQQVISYVD